jgi:cell division topological specificity factor MinE
MLKALRRFFGEKKSGQVARERMQVVLMHDRLDLTPDIMEALKNDILAVLSRYMEIGYIFQMQESVEEVENRYPRTHTFSLRFTVNY